MKKCLEILNTPVALPCGYVVRNRIAKAAMTEHMADSSGLPTKKFHSLYRRWGMGGAAFLLTGNVMVDRGALEGHHNVVLSKGQDLEPFARWNDTVVREGGELWMQIGHAGGLSVVEGAISPSGIQHVGRHRVFPKPRIASEKDIADVIDRFAYAAAAAKNAGFGGVEIHGAHQFLLNQFLSPATNKREDIWGGSLENRARLLLEVVAAVRAEVGSSYPIAVKLNSSDGYNKEGGWTHAESIEVGGMLQEAGIDLIEFSGGSYDVTPMLGPRRYLFKRPESFFYDYAKDFRKTVERLPIMLTGGMRSAKSMCRAISSGVVDVVGVARPMATDPYFAQKILSGQISSAPRSYGEKLKVFEQLQWFRDRMSELAE